MQRIEFEVVPQRPYSLSRTVSRLVRFTDRVDRMNDSGRYSRCLHLDGDLALLTVTQVGTAARAQLRVSVLGKGLRRRRARAGAEQFVARSLGASCPLRSFYRAFRDDSLLAGSIRANRGMSLCGGATLFEAIITSILAQQVNLAFAYSIYQALAERYGERLEFEGEEFVAFPTPERIARVRHATLRNMKLSNAKAAAIHRIAQAFAKGEIDERALADLSDEEVIERLTAYKGIGRWTAETSMIRGLGRLNVFPAGDLGVVKKIAVEMLGHTGVAKEDEMRAFSKRWHPYRSLALIYAYATLYNTPRKAG